MLPDKSVYCHRTAFEKTCFECVTEKKCRLWMHVSGTDAMGRDIDVYGCGDEFAIKMQHETSKEVRQAAASVDKVASEVKTSRDQATAEHAHLINGMKAGVLPLLQLSGMAEQKLLENDSE